MSLAQSCYCAKETDFSGAITGLRHIMSQIWRNNQIAPNEEPMPKPTQQSLFDAILRAVAFHHEGANLEKIIGASGLKLSRRTLQRLLALLAKKNLLLIEGKTKARVYRLPGARQSVKIISLSSVAESLQNKVLRPIQKRHHVSYNRDFLDAYHPNKTYYLSSKVRSHLLEIGRSPDEKRPAGTYARQIFNRLLIDLAWNSSRLEGNTYSLLETRRLLEFGMATEGKNAKETQMILNHKAAIEFLVESADDLRFNRYMIFNLHALLSSELLPDGAACGRLRNIPVGIGQSVYLPLEVPQLIDECFQQVLDIAEVIKDPFEQAFFVMVHLPYLQPFEDVNKRVSRLAANLPLIRQNLRPLSFVDVPEDVYINGLLCVYELNRIELLREIFIWAYERSCSAYLATRNVIGDPDPFRIRYRNLIIETVCSIVHACMDKKTAIEAIQQQARTIPTEDQDRFIELTELEILNLHEGNIARYKLRPSEYVAWKKEFV